MSREGRFFATQASINDAKRALWDARGALNGFRHHRNASRFPDLREYLAKKSGRNYRSMDLSGWGPDYHGLTEEEYSEFKAAYLETEVGKNDTWKNYWDPNDKFF